MSLSFKIKSNVLNVWCNPEETGKVIKQITKDNCISFYHFVYNHANEDTSLSFLEELLRKKFAGDEKKIERFKRSCYIDNIDSPGDLFKVQMVIATQRSPEMIFVSYLFEDTRFWRKMVFLSPHIKFVFLNEAIFSLDYKIIEYQGNNQLKQIFNEVDTTELVIG